VVRSWTLAGLSDTAAQVLVVVDYADTRVPQLCRLSGTVGEASEIAAVRFSSGPAQSVTGGRIWDGTTRISGRSYGDGA
jgi:hypothetical protein